MSRGSGVITFRELIDREYLAKGVNKLQAFVTIYMAADVSLHSSRAAYNGTRVLAETAIKLRDWVAMAHRVWIDPLALVDAPVAKPRKKRAGPRATV